VIETFVPFESLENLPIPLVVCTTDFSNGKIAIFAEGSAKKIVVASCSIPLIYTPVTINGSDHVDGGLMSNMPADIIRNKCKKLLGVHVNPVGKTIRKGFSGKLERIFQLAVLSGIEHQIKICDMFIEPAELSRFSVFDTRHAHKIFEIGYKQAISRKDELLGLIEG
jgi:NTE family protein